MLRAHVQDSQTFKITKGKDVTDNERLEKRIAFRLARIERAQHELDHVRRPRRSMLKSIAVSKLEIEQLEQERAPA